MGLPDHTRRNGEAHGALGVLFVAGDRLGGPRQDALNLHGEYKAIKESIGRGARREELVLFDPLFAATTRELVMGLARQAPGIAHFAGHGQDRALVLVDANGLPTRFTEDDAVQLFASLHRAPTLAVFTACRSLPVARRLLEHVEFAIGVEGDLDDGVAVQFTSALYELIAEGQPLGRAFNLALVAARVMRDANAPVLLVRDGIDSIAAAGPGDLLAQARARCSDGAASRSGDSPPSPSPHAGAGLAGRFVALEGSADPDGRDHDLLRRCHALVRMLVAEVFEAGGGMTLFVSGEPLIESASPPLPCVFHWTVLEAVAAYARGRRRAGAESGRVLARCVISPKTLEKRIPSHRRSLWDELLDARCVTLELLEEDAHIGGRIRSRLVECSAALVTLGGGKGVADSAEYFRDREKPCVPLNAAIGGFSKDGEGSPGLYRRALLEPARFVGIEPEEFRASLQRLSLADPSVSLVTVAQRLGILLGRVVSVAPRPDLDSAGRRG